MEQQSLTLTPNEAANILRDCGFGIGYDKLAEGLRQGGIYPFGIAYVMGSGLWTYIIYRKDLYDFIRCHGGTPPSDLDTRKEL